jgi:hypothetical protein
MKYIGKTGDQNRNNSKDDQLILHTGQLFGKNNTAAYFLYAGTVEPQRSRGKRATGELRIVSSCC